MAKGSKESKYREGKWKCTAEGTYSDTICGHINPGPEKLCGKCHSHRPKDVAFFLDDDAKVLSSAEKIADAKSAPDWKCYHCNYDNNAEDDICAQCRELRDTNEEKWLGFDQDLKTKAYSKKKTTSAVKAKSPIMRYLKIGGIAVGALLLIFVIYKFFFATTEYEVTVTGFSWEREILIEEMQLVKEEGWDYPSNARVLKKEEKQSGTEQVYSHSEWSEEPVYEDVKVGERYVDCGTEDKGNGYFETKQCLEDVYERQQVGTEEVEHEVFVDEPVYDIWYTYEVEKWSYAYSETASANDKNAFWPAYKTLKKERVQDKHETYIIHLKSNDSESKHQTLVYEAGQAEWDRIELNETFIADVKRSGTVTNLKPL